MTIDELRGLSMGDALKASGDMDSQSRAGLISACGAWDHRPLFALRVAQDLTMPQDLTNGLSQLQSNFRGGGGIGDFGEGRMYILRYFASHPADPRVTKAKETCWNNWFYPEYKDLSNVRDRFVQIAKDHAGLDSSDLMQAELFSLNGFFDWSQAQQSARTWTTCGLFVRACRSAARILERKKWATNTPSGTDPCITGTGNASVVPRLGGQPQKGDIFHVGKPGTNNNHVGVILSHIADGTGTWHWETVEGGQGHGYKTQYFADRTLALDDDGFRYHGEGQYRRPLLKWIDLDLLARPFAQ